jgi:hypothetical protein
MERGNVWRLLMSYDTYSSEYYLTLDGWTTTKEELAPRDNLETWRKDSYQGSGFGRESSTWHMLWRDLAFSKEQSVALHERFPFPERPRIPAKIMEDLLKNI